MGWDGLDGHGGEGWGSARAAVFAPTTLYDVPGMFLELAATSTNFRSVHLNCGESHPKREREARKAMHVGGWMYSLPCMDAVYHHRDFRAPTKQGRNTSSFRPPPRNCTRAGGAFLQLPPAVRE